MISRKKKIVLIKKIKGAISKKKLMVRLATSKKLVIRYNFQYHSKILFLQINSLLVSL